MATAHVEPGDAPANAPVQPSRRTLLGLLAAPAAAMALPLSARAAPRPDCQQWEAVLAEYRRACAVRDAYHRDHLKPASTAHSAVRDRWPLTYDFAADPAARKAIDEVDAILTPVQGRYDELCALTSDAEDAVWLTPAPTISALAIKLTLFRTEDGCNHTDAGTMIDAFIADARRLAAGEA